MLRKNREMNRLKTASFFKNASCTALTLRAPIFAFRLPNIISARYSHSVAKHALPGKSYRSFALLYGRSVNMALGLDRAWIRINWGMSDAFRLEAPQVFDQVICDDLYDHLALGASPFSRGTRSTIPGQFAE